MRCKPRRIFAACAFTRAIPSCCRNASTTDCCNGCRRCALQKVVVIHANHASELDETVQRACRDLAGAGATLLNQSVLLAGVNDSVDGAGAN